MISSQLDMILLILAVLCITVLEAENGRNTEGLSLSVLASLEISCQINPQNYVTGNSDP